jgi:2-alkenal reductase
VAASEAVTTRLGVQGVVIVRTAPGSPSEKAGLRGVNPTTGALGDVIVAVNERQVRRLADLTDEIEQVGVGKTVNLTLNRGGSQTSITVEITDIGASRP